MLNSFGLPNNHPTRYSSLMQRYSLDDMPRDEDKTKAEVVDRFCEETSTVGVIFWWKSIPSYFWTILWTVALIAAWAISIYQVVILFIKYYEYNTIVSVKVGHSTNATFPAVTICNVNQIRYKYFKANQHNYPTLMETMGVMEEVKGGPDINSSTQEQSIEAVAKLASDNVYDMVQYLIYDLKIDIANGGHQLDEMLIECNFQGELCNTSDFIRWEDPYYGNCYTLSFESDSFSSFIGPRYGLKLILYTQIHEYIPIATSDIGFRVQLHPMEYVPFPRDEGFSIAPGFVTSVAIKELQMERQPKPYDGTDCGEHMDNKNLFDYWSHLTKSKTGQGRANYSANACIKQCYMETLRKKCSCYDPSVITYNYAVMFAKVKKIDVPAACDITASNDCMSNVAKEINSVDSDCMKGCKQPCHELAFVPRVTNSLWPNKDYFKAMFNVWKNRVPGMEINSPEDRLTALAKLEVYYEDLNFQSIKETPAMDIWALLTDIGGIFGLYTGVCFLTALEFLQFFYKLMLARNKTNATDSPRRVSSIAPFQERRMTSFGEDLNPPYPAKPSPVELI